MKIFFIFFLSGFGTGLLPKMPGTWGSMLGIFLMSASLVSLPALSPEVLGLIWGGIGIGLGIFGWLFLSFFSEKELQSSAFSSQNNGYDQPWITLDEVMGVIFAGVPAFFSSHAAWVLFLGFLLFRFFDIQKPLGIRQIDRLHTPLSVFLDDALAGVYSAIMVISLLFCVEYFSLFR